MSKHDMGEHGYSAFFKDSEGNRIGLATSKMIFFEMADATLLRLGIRSVH
jgi:hypothetical protein